MSLNGISGSVPSSTTSATTSTATTSASKSNTSAAESTASKANDTGVVYEAGSKTASTSYKPDTATIDKMKADADARTGQLRSLVQKLISKQGEKISDADMWQSLREGKFNADPATIAQAQKDVAEDGYYGVEQVSDRMISFAKALTGGDPSKADEMMKAFEKGFKEATKSWGGKLPDISQKTYDATIKKFEEWKNGGATQSTQG